MIYALAGLFILLQAGDGWTTYQALKSKDNMEANPVVAKLIKAIGIVPALLIMKLIAVAVAIVLAYLSSYTYYASLFGLIVLNGLYSYVVYNNYRLTKG